jgi:hypothetical protein
MSNYVIKRTDPANGSFVVQSDQINGTTRPGNAAFYTNPSTGLTALASNTSLVIAGRGITDYGELVQNNLVYLTENFAGPTRPLTPLQGQIWYKNTAVVDAGHPTDPTNVGLYVWSGAIWSPVLAANATGIIDLNGAKISGLGAATLPTDALNIQTADLRYLQIGGGVGSGLLTLSGGLNVIGGAVTFVSGVSVTVTDAPTAVYHATNKGYVDSRDGVVTGLITSETAARTAADTAINATITTITGQLGAFVNTTGDTMTGTLVIDQNASFNIIGGGTGQINLGSRKIQQVGTPTLNTDATNKLYVDAAITAAIGGLPPTSTSDGVVYAGNLNPISGVLTLNRTLGLPDVLVSGNFAPQVHQHVTNDIKYDFSTIYSQSLLSTSENGTIGFPIVPLTNIIRTLDQVVTDVARPVKRKIIVTDGIASTYSFGSQLTYTVNENKLMIFADGVKKYCNERGSSIITFTGSPINPNSNTGLAPGTYTFSINVNGTGNVAVSIIVPAGAYSYYKMALAINTALTALSVPCSINIEQYYTHFDLKFESNTTGTGSSVVISYLATELFFVLSTASAPVNTSITSNQSYFEVGLPGVDSTSITFNAVPIAGIVLEATLIPG